MGWNNLGMHCMDSDYSVFSILPPYNTINAQLIVGGKLAENLSGGGNPLLWQHLFWFLGHPEVYVLILPGMGIVAELIANNTRKPLWGYHSLVYSALFAELLLAHLQSCGVAFQDSRFQTDNGSEFTAETVRTWLAEKKVGPAFIPPGQPWKNGFIESFHDKFRDECLQREWFSSLLDVQVMIADWRLRYNTQRPHSSLSYKTPAAFAAQHNTQFQSAQTLIPVGHKN